MASLPRRVFLVITLDDCMIGSSTFWSKAVGMPVKGGYDGPCTNTFGKCFHAGAEVAEEDMRALQGIIPDMVIDARDCEHAPFPSQNDVVGRKSLVEHKTLASLLLSVQARARKVLTDIKKRAEELNARHPGSTLYTSWACTPSTSFWSPGLLAAFPAISTFWWSSLLASGRCT